MSGKFDENQSKASRHAAGALCSYITERVI